MRRAIVFILLVLASTCVAADVFPKVEITKFTWELGGFDAVLLVNLRIRNGHDFAVKDMTIVCEEYAPSGTVVYRNRNILYQRLAAGQTRQFNEVNMGFAHNQVHRVSCLVVSAERA